MTILAAAPGPVTAASPNQVVPASSKGSSKAALYAGIGGGVGAVVLCLLLALCIWNYVHRKIQSRGSERTNSSKGTNLLLPALCLPPEQPMDWFPSLQIVEQRARELLEMVLSS